MNNPTEWDSFKGNTIVLVGSTGMGKSALGSFLFDSENYEKNPIFKRATRNTPQTNEVQLAYTDEFCIIDTPGLNESAEKDLKHMIEVYNVIKKQQYISAIVICVNFAKKIDISFRKTIKYYTDFFQSCLSSNVIIVVTNVLMDKRTIRRRQIDKFDVNDSIKGLADEINKIANIPTNIPIFTIDSYPLKDDDSYMISLKCKKNILEYVKQLPKYDVKDMLFRKTMEMDYDDELKISSYLGNMYGFLEAMEEYDKISTEQHDDYIKKIREINRSRERLEYINSEKEVIIHSINKYIPKGVKEEFKIQLKYPVSRYFISFDGIVKVVDNVFNCEATGNDEFVTITLFCKRRDYYADEIKSIKEAFDNFPTNHYVDYVKEKLTDIQKYINKYVTIDEAVEKMKK